MKLNGLKLKIVKDEKGYEFGILYGRLGLDNPLTILGYHEMKAFRDILNEHFAKEAVQ